MKKINVGIIGLGTVGGGVARTLIDKKNLLKDRTGVSINLTKVYDKDRKMMTRLKLPKKIIAKNAAELVQDKNIDILVELIGGVHPAREIMLEALSYGKHIVTANKALLAECGKEVFGIVKEAGCSIGFEASVCGAMPVIKVLNESFSANIISALYGIVNGTCNFVISKMSEDNYTFKQALKEAQVRGLAEANPTLDIDGKDACHKLCILTMLSFGIFVKPRDIYVEGIRNIDLQDIVYAREWGYDVKLLAIAKKVENSLELRVHPTLIPVRHLLSSVKGEDNAVFVKGDMMGESMLYGKGAGRFPAASSVVSDVIDLARNPGASLAPLAQIKEDKKTKVKKIGDLKTRYYIRFLAIDQPGVLASVSTILAKNKISIATVSQKERKQGQPVPLVIMTHSAKESSMNKALKEINKLKTIKKKPVKIRIEK